jgi:23S rRNA (guanosine2251-2'-O)-methyltransferase
VSTRPRRGGPPRRPGGPGRTARPPRDLNGAPARRRPRLEGVGGDQVEGRRAVLELLSARRRPVRAVYVAEGQDPSQTLDAIEALAQKRRIPVHAVSRARLDKMATTEGHQGVLAHAAPLDTVGLEELEGDPRAFLLVCDGVTDPRNLGAMLRSADGAGVTGVVLARHRAARITPTAAKAAAGAIEYLRFCDVGGIPSAIDELNRAGLLTVGLAGEVHDSLYDLDFSSTPVALVVGNEEKGLSQLTRKRCGAVVSIPQIGHVSSLNAGVALSVAAFEVARQRRD